MPADADPQVTIKATVESLEQIKAKMAKIKTMTTHQGQVATPEQIAKAFDVPLELVAPEHCVNHSPHVEGPHLGANAWLHQHFQPSQLSNHSSGLAVDLNWTDNPMTAPDHLHFEPTPEHLAGDGDPENDAKNAYFITGDGSKTISWTVPLEDIDPGFLELVMGSPVDTPKHGPLEGTQHPGPDGALWEFHLAGGWRIVQDLASPINRAPYGWWCSCCEEHWSVHKGDPVGCDSGGWLRPATSDEHKRVLLGEAGSG